MLPIRGIYIFTMVCVVQAELLFIFILLFKLLVSYSIYRRFWPGRKDLSGDVTFVMGGVPQLGFRRKS